jgi:hypothetical protein
MVGTKRMGSRLAFFVFAICVVILMASFVYYSYQVSNHPESNYGWDLLNEEIRNFALVADAKDIHNVNYITHKTNHFFTTIWHGNLSNIYETIWKTYGVLIQLFLIRVYMYKFVLPLVVFACLLAIIEGYVKRKSKLENFKLTSPFLFHHAMWWGIGLCTFVFLGYLFSPIPVNPFIVIYGIPLFFFVILYVMFSNLPVGKL